MLALIAAQVAAMRLQMPGQLLPLHDTDGTNGSLVAV